MPLYVPVNSTSGASPTCCSAACRRCSKDAPAASTLRPRRVQNQRRQTRINRALDAANLLFEIVRVLR